MTVCVFQVDITRDGCGTTKLCLEEPAGCDPTTDDSCLFVSLVATPGPTKGVDLAVELRGKIDQPVGFVGVSLTFKDGSTSLFPCIRNGSDDAPFFRTFWRKNACSGFFLVQNRATGIRIVPKGHVIRCGFDIREVNASVIRDRLPIADTTFIISAATGTASTDGIPGAFIPTLEKHVNVADPTGGNVFDVIGTPAVVGSNAAATGSNAAATGSNAAALGSNAAATGSNAAAPGSNAAAPDSNAVAPGNTAAAAPGNTAAASNGAHAVPILLSVLALFIMLGA
ncbi:hypothetical protein D5F01_LYC10190 [Larimichthys crocea]|uniref:Ferric-chelate reductase 1 n=1 Tax=Larimichthys crocea TaxID=215358 RepID=A0A6G0IGV1_LARCR|nr:hypothetical protein D5F01_LYC10190 [Larimichthys crocea]